MKLESLKNVVYKILNNVELARNDDFLLYAWVCNDLGIDLSMSTGEFLFGHIELKVPPFGSVTRCRRKWQEKHPELVKPKTKEARNKEQEQYIKFSKE